MHGPAVARELPQCGGETSALRRVAVVNDDPGFLALMQDVLEMEGWEPLILRESDSVIDALKQAQPDLILLEIREDRPQAGWTMVERLTNDPETGHTPIVICAGAVQDVRAREQWLADHRIGVLAEPFEIDDACRAIRTGLELRKSADTEADTL